MPKDINRDDSQDISNFRTTHMAQRRQQVHIIQVCFAWQVLFGIFLSVLVWGRVARGRQHNTGHNGPKSEQLSPEYLLKFWNF